MELLYKYVECGGVNPKLLEEAFEERDDTLIWKALYVCKLYTRAIPSDKIEVYVNAIVSCLSMVDCQTDNMMTGELIDMLEVVTNQMTNKGIVEKNCVKGALFCMLYEMGDGDLVRVVNCLCKYYSKRITLNYLAKLLVEHREYHKEECEELLLQFDDTRGERIMELIRAKEEK
jgi:hypothetical protein